MKTITPSETRASRADRLLLVAAFVVTVAWCALYVGFSREGLCDEPWHLGLMNHFAKNRADWPETGPHLPGYHWLVVVLTAGNPTYAGARAVTGVLACLALAAFAGAWRRTHGRVEGVGAATMCVALLPILQPFTGMAYTDVPALALLLCAWWAQVAERRGAAAALLAVACFIRQTSIIWSALFIAWEGLQAWRSGARGRALVAAIARRTCWLLSLQLVIAGVIASGSFTPGAQVERWVRPNVATAHFAAVLVAVLGAPLWIPGLRRAWRDLWAHRQRGGVLATAGLACAAIFAVTYSNPHPWNRDLWWPGISFTLLRNWPLVALERFPWLRAASGLLIVSMIWAVVRLVVAEPRRAELAGAFLSGAVLLATNNLVEPRYFITPAVFVLFFLAPDLTRSRRLSLWFLLLCAAHAPFILTAKALW